MDELVLDGKTYISSKRAAATTGYAKDYVGQLCREGRIEARLVGRSWYVHEPSIQRHRFNEQGTDEATPTEEPKQEVQQEPKTEEPSEKTNIQAIWERPTYSQEEVPEIPLSQEETVEHNETKKDQDPEEYSGTIEEIEGAWQSWFSTESAAPQKEDENIIEEQISSTPETETSLQSEDAVPIHVLEPQNEPRSVFVDMPREVPVSIPPPVASRLKARKKHRANNRLVLKALFLAIMLISISIAVIGSGIGRSRIENSQSGPALIQYLEGETTIK